MGTRFDDVDVAAGRRSGIDTTLWLVQFLMAALFAFAGINKLFGIQQERSTTSHASALACGSAT
jgi:hypothetical protein